MFLEQTLNITLRPTMSLPATVPVAILETVLIGLTAVFLTGAGGDIAMAREAARQMLGIYQPQSEDELRLAANIIAFGFRTVETLGQASAPGLPTAVMLRLHASAVGLSREAARAERRLVQLRKARQPVIAAQATKTAPASLATKVAKASALMRDALASDILNGDVLVNDAQVREFLTEEATVQPPGKVAAAAKASGVTWTQAYNDRQRDLRIAASIKKAEARVAAQSTAATVQESVPMDVAV